jgi:hypothetical protein
MELTWHCSSHDDDFLKRRRERLKQRQEKERRLDAVSEMLSYHPASRVASDA